MTIKDDKVHGELFRQLELHSQTQSEILQVVTRIDTRCKTCQQTLHEHEQAINGLPGNGSHPGIKTRVATAEERIETIRTDMDKIDQRYSWVVRSLIGCGLTLIGGLLLWGAQVLLVTP